MLSTNSGTGECISGRWGNDLTTIPNPVNCDTDSTRQPPPTPDCVCVYVCVAVASIALTEALRTILTDSDARILVSRDNESRRR